MSSIAHMLVPSSGSEGASPTHPADTRERPQLEQPQIADGQPQHHHPQHQRKRSKVSRACDECRRKKVKCDATFSTTSNTVLRPCSNCSKNGDNCSFERVPLKRGPSKGFVRSDPISDVVAERSRASSFQSQQQGIVLPPLTSLTSGSSQPNSPRNSISMGETNINNNANANPVPQGLFWKVPYQGSFERRGSIDSLSSSSQVYRVNYESSVISDSDDEVGSQRRSRSRSNSGNLPVPASPALSISSLKSLNQGFTKSLSLNPQLCEVYYQFIHTNFPILPLNRQSLTNLLAVPQSNNPEVSDTNAAVIHSFYLSLDVLLGAVSRNTTTRSPDDIHNLFASLFRIFAKIHASTGSYSQNVIILLSSALLFLCYTVVLLGIHTDVNINSTVAVFHKFQFHRLFWEESPTTNNNCDDYNSIVKRLYIQLTILDTLQSLAFGVPKCVNFKVDPNVVDSLFPSFVQGFDITKNNMRLGLLLTQLCESRDFSKPYTSMMYPKESGIVRDVDQDGLTANFWDVIVCKYELIAFLDEVNKEKTLDEESLHDYQFKCSRMVKKNLSVQGNLLSSIKNYTNSIDNNMLISPYLPLIFKQSVKFLNVNKVIINSLQTNKDLVTRLSKLLNDVISLTNYLSLLKPFKAEEMNNHLQFQFHSHHLAHFTDGEDISLPNNLTQWLGLMRDIDRYLRADDYDGWF